MEHHLGFWPVPLLRGRNRGRGEGVVGTLPFIIVLWPPAKSSIFESCWSD